MQFVEAAGRVEFVLCDSVGYFVAIQIDWLVAVIGFHRVFDWFAERIAVIERADMLCAKDPVVDGLSSGDVCSGELRCTETTHNQEERDEREPEGCGQSHEDASVRRECNANATLSNR
jgi:hypothetical protein